MLKKKKLEASLHKEFNSFVLRHKPGYYNPLTRLIKRRYSLRNKRIFEFGCGTGDFLLSFADSGAKSLLGMDIARPAIQEAQAKLKKFPQKNIKFVCENLLEKKWPYPPQDLVVSYGVLQYIPDLQKALNRLNDVMSDGGVFINGIIKGQKFSFSNFVQWFNFFLAPDFLRKRFYWVFKLLFWLRELVGKSKIEEDEAFLKGEARYLGIPALHYKSKKELRSAFIKAGFSKIKFEKGPPLHQLSQPHYLITAIKQKRQ